MSAGVQAGLVQLAIAGLLVVAWYSGTWATIVDELVAGIIGGGPARAGRTLRGLASGAAVPAGASAPSVPAGITATAGGFQERF